MHRIPLSYNVNTTLRSLYVWMIPSWQIFLIERHKAPGLETKVNNCFLITKGSLCCYKLTLILAARCIDGVVIVGDSKITDVMGTLLHYEPKYAGALRNVLFGYSGVVHMFKVFERYVVGDVVILRDSNNKYTPETLLEKISDAMHVLLEARSNQYFSLQIMVGRQFPNDGNSDLHIVDSRGNMIRFVLGRQ